MTEKQEALEKEKLLVKDERVRDAFYVYKEIVNMPIPTDGLNISSNTTDYIAKAKLQNIKNASYFIWALYSNEKTATLTVLAIEETKQRGLNECTTAEEFLAKEAERNEKT